MMTMEIICRETAGKNNLKRLLVKVNAATAGIAAFEPLIRSSDLTAAKVTIILCTADWVLQSPSWLSSPVRLKVRMLLSKTNTCERRGIRNIFVKYTIRNQKPSSLPNVFLSLSISLVNCKQIYYFRIRLRHIPTIIIQNNFVLGILHSELNSSTTDYLTGYETDFITTTCVKFNVNRRSRVVHIRKQDNLFRFCRNKQQTDDSSSKRVVLLFSLGSQKYIESTLGLPLQYSATAMFYVPGGSVLTLPTVSVSLEVYWCFRKRFFCHIINDIRR